MKPEVRLHVHADWSRSERMSQSDERKTYFSTRSCVRVNLVLKRVPGSLISSFKDVASTLKPHTCHKRVCGTETSISMQCCTPSPFSYAVWLNVDWAGSTDKHTIWNFEQTSSCVHLPVDSAFFLHLAQQHMEKGWGSSIESLVSVLQTPSLGYYSSDSASEMILVSQFKIAAPSAI